MLPNVARSQKKPKLGGYIYTEINHFIVIAHFFIVCKKTHTRGISMIQNDES